MRAHQPKQEEEEQQEAKAVRSSFTYGYSFFATEVGRLLSQFWAPIRSLTNS